MAETTYDFDLDDVEQSQLTQEILASGITDVETQLVIVENTGEPSPGLNVHVTFLDALSAPDVVLLNAVIAAHPAPEPPPEEGDSVEVGPEGTVDPGVLPQATESALGAVELATQAETDAGTDDSRAVTPKKLADWAGAPSGGGAVEQEFAFVGKVDPYVEVDSSSWTTFARAIYPGTGAWTIEEVQAIAHVSSGMGYIRIVDEGTGLVIAELVSCNTNPSIRRTQTINNLPASRSMLEFQAKASVSKIKIGSIRIMSEGEEVIVEPCCEGFWQFDEAAGSYDGTAGEAVDSSGSDRHGTAAGNADVVVDGTRGNVLSLVSSGDYIDVGTWNVFNTGLTLAAWIKPSSFGTDPRIIMKGISTSNQDWGLMIDNGSPNRLGMRAKINGSLRAHYAGTISAGSWVHVCGRYDGSKFRLYINGVQVGSDSSTYTGTIATSGASIWIGDQPGAQGQRKFLGQIDEVHVFSRALTDQEVLDLYNGTN